MSITFSKSCHARWKISARSRRSRAKAQSLCEVSTIRVSGWVKDPILAYSNTFRDHLANPRHAGELDNATVVAEETNPICGDRLRLSLRIRNGRIEAARFLAYGCPPTLACGSALTEILEGMSVEEAHALAKDDVAKAVGGLPKRKHHAATLAIETLHSALNYNKKGGP
jgi:NifU-like protein involved in Fe-S cluster formation